MNKFYGVLFILGIALPYRQFILWIADNGFAGNALIAEILNSRISAHNATLSTNR